MSNGLDNLRSRLDEIDDTILDLLSQRQQVVHTVSEVKKSGKVPIFVADREDQKTTTFRAKAREHGLDEDWAEDFLRMMMSASRANQSEKSFPCATNEPKTIVLCGGRGGMGRLYAKLAAQSGHEVRIFDKDDYDNGPSIFSGADAVIVSVPIHKTAEVIASVSKWMEPDTILADFTSLKEEFVQQMLEHHNGPVAGLHPMHGPDVSNVSRQLMVVCEGRFPEKYAWLIEQFSLWGMRIKKADARQHDKSMHLVQGLRHFVALLHASFMNKYEMRPEDILDYSSPIYRAELMMTGRIFAQDAELYADIVFSDSDRTQLLNDFFEHHSGFTEMVKRGDKKAFIREFSQAAAFFGDFAPRALKESSYLINRLADRFG
ncbi:MAG: bifunctional chorismate mutase/prephenate dehydrogenase [Balneolales bacterium]|nr:bifunctional chorismate mutase/prephenate dehydrogenase [Balneolales bacterium]